MTFSLFASRSVSPSFFSSPLWLSSVGLAGVVFVVFWFISQIPPSNDAPLQALDAQRLALRSEIARLQDYPPLFPVHHIWADAVDGAGAYGLRWTAATTSNFKDVPRPAGGSSQYWQGVMSGTPSALLLGLRLFAWDVASPYRPVAMQITDKGASALILVYGSTHS